MRRAAGLAIAAELMILGAVAPAFAQGLTPKNVNAIFDACQETAGNTTSPLRQPAGSPTKMWCAVVDREGKLLLIQATDTGGTPQNPGGSDAWRGSIEIAIAKAYTAVAFSSNQQALDSKTIGLLARPDGCTVLGTCGGTVGADTGPAPLFGIGNTNPFRILGGGPGDDAVGLRHRGIVTFAGGQPVYNCDSGALLGAVGVSGDGVDQDDTVAKGAVTGAGFCTGP